MKRTTNPYDISKKYDGDVISNKTGNQPKEWTGLEYEYKLLRQIISLAKKEMIYLSF